MSLSLTPARTPSQHADHPQSARRPRKIMQISAPPQGPSSDGLSVGQSLWANGPSSPRSPQQSDALIVPRPKSASGSVASDEQKRKWRATPRGIDLHRLSSAALKPAPADTDKTWGALPPSPNYTDNALHKAFWQWSKEASRPEDKDQRSRVAAQCVQVSMTGQHTLQLLHLPRVLDLPNAFEQLTTLRTLELENVGLNTLPDLSALVHLKHLTLKDCRKLTNLTWSLSWLRRLQCVNLIALPRLTGTLLLPAHVTLTVSACPLLRPVSCNHPPTTPALHNLR
jgi:hypothetical protein